ncbi:MAG: hypothetical protein HKO53_01395 [Gemmatimonadetes bacterium]|nr:hypothetical protein [Gemmatimonadota bacterium]
MSDFPAPQGAPSAPPAEVVNVVGMSFVDEYPDFVLTMDQLIDDEDTAFLVPNPANPHDANAVEVHYNFPAIGWKMVGHLPRDMAAHWSGYLRDSGAYECKIWTRIAEGKESYPGLTVRITKLAAHPFEEDSSVEPF